MTDPNIFNQFLIWPILNVLIAFYKGMEYVHIPYPLTWAIITMTIFIRLILYPLTMSQLKSAKKMAELKPHIDALSRKHKDNKTLLQQEQMKLYQQHGINPAAGCLPMLLQFPILIALYRVFYDVLSTKNPADLVKQINAVMYHPALHIEKLDLSFFGTQLTATPNHWQQIGVAILFVPVITAFLQFLQAKTMNMGTSTTKTPPAANDKDKKDSGDDFAKTMQTQMTYIFPVFIGYLAFSFPLGLSLYWNTFSVFGIIQQLIVNKAEPIQPIAQEKKEETLLALDESKNIRKPKNKKRKK